MNQIKNWFTHPTKKTLILCTLIWFIGNLLLIIGATNLFSENISTPVKGLITSSSILVFGLFISYSKNRKLENTTRNEE